MPPTPVAAPWNGSTALGWLWDSTLKATARPASDVDRAGVLARTHHEPRALGRQRPQQQLRVLVGAVLGPQQREHRQLDLARLAPEPRHDRLVLARAQAERERALAPRRGPDAIGRRRRRGGAGSVLRRARPRAGPRSSVAEPRPDAPARGPHAAAAASDANRPSPSVEPVRGSTACSGWGISPKTLPASLTTPATSASDPFGFSPRA